MDSPDPPLAFNDLYGDRRRQLRRHGIGGTSCVDRLLATAPTLSAPAQRSVLVCAAVCHQMGQRVTEAAESMMKKVTTTTKKRTGGSKEGSGGHTPSQLIDARIKELSDWRGKTLARIRSLIKQADPEVVEEWKWRGVPVWSHAGIICTGETYKSVVKMTFAKGAALKDPARLFNSSLEGNTRRAIDIHEGEKIDEEALKTLVRAAVTLNKSKAQS